jgi:hypothetical protein
MVNFHTDGKNELRIKGFIERDFREKKKLLLFNLREVTRERNLFM